MNCIPGRTTERGSPCLNRLRIIASACLYSLAIVLGACSAPASESDTPPTPGAMTYRVDYRVAPDPAAGAAQVELRISQPRHLLRVFDMQRGNIDVDSLEGDGEMVIDNDRVLWSPPG